MCVVLFCIPFRVCGFRNQRVSRYSPSQWRAAIQWMARTAVATALSHKNVFSGQIRYLYQCRDKTF